MSGGVEQAGIQSVYVGYARVVGNVTFAEFAADVELAAVAVVALYVSAHEHKLFFRFEFLVFYGTSECAQKGCRVAGFGVITQKSHYHSSVVGFYGLGLVEVSQGRVGAVEFEHRASHCEQCGYIVRCGAVYFVELVQNGSGVVLEHIGSYYVACD